MHPLGPYQVGVNRTEDFNAHDGRSSFSNASGMGTHGGDGGGIANDGVVGGRAGAAVS
jgi:hypothetical protein